MPQQPLVGVVQLFQHLTTRKKAGIPVQLVYHEPLFEKCPRGFAQRLKAGKEIQASLLGVGSGRQGHGSYF